MQVAPTVEMKASDNPALQNVEPDPTIFCSAFKKNRFYLVRQKGIHFKVTALHFFLSYYKFFVVSFWSFRRENQRIPRAPIPTETSLTRSPQKKRWWPPRRPRAPRECLTVPSSTPLWETSTSSFSLWSKSSVWMLLAPPFTLEDRNRTFPLFGFRCPKTVENFCVHSRNGYYNGHIFHRVIKVRCPFSLWSLAINCGILALSVFLFVVDRVSWFRLETPQEQAWEERASGEGSLKTSSTPRWDTTAHTHLAWQTEARAPMAHSFLSPWYPL